MAIEWTFEIDFDRDNNWTPLINRVRGAIKWSWGVDPYTHIWKDEPIQVTLHNEDRAFSPEERTSPYYGKLLPGRPCRLKADGEVQFLGIIEDYQAAPKLYDKRTTVLTIRSLKVDLDRSTYAGQIWENKRADEIIGELLPLVRLPPTVYGAFQFDHPVWGKFDGPTFVDPDDFLTVNDTGYHTFAFVGDNLQGAGNQSSNDNALNDAIQRNRPDVSVYNFFKGLMETERGRLYIGRNGKLIFDNRYTWIERLTPDWIVDNDATGPMDYKSGYATLIDRVSITYQPRTVYEGYDAILWALETPVIVPANSSITLDCVYTDSSGGRFLQHPIGDDFVYSGGALSVSINESAQRALVTLTNTSISASTVTTLIIRGQSIRSANPGLVTVYELSIGAELFVTKPLELNIRGLDNYDDALEVANLELRRRAVNQPYLPKVGFIGVPADTSDRQLAGQVGHRVTALDDQTSHDYDYHLCKIIQSLQVDGKELTTTWMLEPAHVPALLLDDDGEPLLDDDGARLYEDIY